MRVRLTTNTDPGPCPVDDTPHTACTSSDYVGRSQTVSVPLRRPRGFDQVVPVVEPPPPVTFTTGEYTRVKHGPRRKTAR